jgi:broad specificity phosphatase PhoE
MDVFLLRHGQSEYNIGLTDHLDSPLTPLGRQQAKRAAERLGGENITQVFVSPLRRTLETIAPFCRVTGLPAHAVPDLREYFSTPLYCDFPGMSAEIIQREFPFARCSTHFPDEEPWWPRQQETEAVLYGRAQAVLDLLLGEFAHTDTHLLIVSHADTVGRLREAFQHLPPRQGDPPWSDNCGISRLSCPADPALPATVVYENDTAYLSGLPS